MDQLVRKCEQNLPRRYCFICDKGALTSHYTSLTSKRRTATKRPFVSQKKVEILTVLQSLLVYTIETSKTWEYLCDSCRKKAEKIYCMKSADPYAVATRNVFVAMYKKTTENHSCALAPRAMVIKLVWGVGWAGTRYQNMRGCASLMGNFCTKSPGKSFNYTSHVLNHLTSISRSCCKIL